MTPSEIRDARTILGKLWGLGRPLFVSELGRALRMAPASSGKTILEWERGKAKASGPVTVALTMMLDGAPPPDLAQIQEAARHADGEPVN